MLNSCIISFRTPPFESYLGVINWKLVDTPGVLALGPLGDGEVGGDLDPAAL